MKIARIQLEDGRVARFEVPDDYTAEQAQAAAEAHFSGGEPTSFGEGAGTALGQGMTFGFADELGGLGAAVFDQGAQLFGGGSGNSFGEVYQGVRDNIRENTKEYREENPEVATALEIAGGLAVPGLSAAKLAKGAATGGTVGRSAMSSALTGGLYGAGTSEAKDADEFVLDVAKGMGTGALFGAATGKVAESIARSPVAQRIKSLIPTGDQIASESRALYKLAKDNNFRIKPKALQQMERAIRKEISDIAYDPKLHQNIGPLLKRMRILAKNGATLKDIEKLRKLTATAKGNFANRPEQAMGYAVTRGVDDFLDSLTAGAVSSKNPKAVVDVLKEARRLWAIHRKVDTLDEAVFRAGTRASGLENGLRNEIASILRNPKSRAGFTADELAEMSKLIEGSTVGNVMRWAGNSGLFRGRQSSQLGSLLSGAGGFAVGGLPGALAVPAMGQAAKAGSEKATLGQMNNLIQTVLNSGRSPNTAIDAILQQGMLERAAKAAGAGGGMTAGLLGYAE